MSTTSHCGVLAVSGDKGERSTRIAGIRMQVFREESGGHDCEQSVAATDPPQFPSVKRPQRMNTLERLRQVTDHEQDRLRASVPTDCPSAILALIAAQDQLPQTPGV